MMNSILPGCLVASMCHMIGKLIIFLVHTLSLQRQCTYCQETTSSQEASSPKCYAVNVSRTVNTLQEELALERTF